MRSLPNCTSIAGQVLPARPNFMEVLFIILISFSTTLVRSTFGFGESLIAVPLLILFLPVEVAVPLSVLLSITIALMVVLQDHDKIHLNSAKWLILYAVPGIPVGLMLLFFGSEFWTKFILGLLIFCYALYSLVERRQLRLKSDSRFWLFVCGFFSGVFGGAYGINGPPLVIYGKMRGWSAAHFRATLQAYFFVASTLSVAGYAMKGLLNQEVMVDFCYALPAALPAVFLGRYLNRRLDGDSFYTYVHAGLMLVGAFLLAGLFW